MITIGQHFFVGTQVRRAVVLLMLTVFGAIQAGAQISLTATGGTSTGSFTTLGAAFAAINAGTHTGAITIGISSSTTESGPCVLNSSGAGSASYTSIVINPTNDGVSVTGPSGSGRGLIELNGADNVTINGDNPNTSGINQNLSFVSSDATSVTYTMVIRIALSSVVTSADNDTIKNCIITGSAISGLTLTSATTTQGGSSGILLGANASTTSATTAPSTNTSNTTTIGSGSTALNLTIDNNIINSCSKGIAIHSGAVTVCPVLSITNNTIGNPSIGATNGVYWRGITVNGFGTATIRGNSIYVESAIITATNTAPYTGLNGIVGINVGDVATVGTQAIIERNTIGKVYQNSTNGYSACGINIHTGTGNIIRNNFLYNIKNYGSGSFSFTYAAQAIRLGGGTDHKVYHNTVSMTGSDAGSGNVQSCFSIVATGITGCDVRNNLFSNTITSTSASSAVVDLFLPSGGNSSMALTLNNNAYYTGTTSGLSAIAQVGTSYGSGVYTTANFASASTNPAANLRNYTSTLSTAGTNDNASFASTASAPFISTSNLHITAAVSTQLESGGASAGSTGVTTDIDGQTRPGPTGSVNGGGTAPDIGADEFDGIPALPPTISGATASAISCTANISHTVTATVVANTGTVSTVTLNYNNGTAGSVTMTLSSGTTTNGVWTGTIPAAASGTTVTWSITAVNSVSLSTTITGASYKDMPFSGVTATATANPAAVCTGSSTVLTAATNFAGTVQVGAGSSTSSSSGSPFYHSWGGAKVQYIYTAAELNAAGLGAGNITALALNVTSVGTSYAGFTVSIGSTTQSAFASANTINTVSTVYTTSSYTPVSGTNTFTFTSPFSWNGTDNIVVSYCWSNANTGGTSTTVQWDNYSINVGMYIYADNQTVSTVCGATTTIAASGGSSTTTGRPVTVFSGNAFVPITSYSWSNGTSTVGTTNPLTVTPSANTTYTATLTGAGGCTITSSSVAVTLIALPGGPTGTGSTQCGVGIPAASVSGATGTNIYKWYSASTGGTLLQTGGSTYTSSISTTTTFYVAISNGTCESIRTAVVATVNTPDAVTASTPATPKCINSPITLTATKAAGPNTYTYTWTASPAAGSGIATSLTGATITPTPTAAGTYVYTVTAVDGSCTATSSISVTVNVIPLGVTATATAPTPLCLGGSLALSSTPAVSATLLSENFNGATNSWTTVNNSTGGSNAALVAWTLRADGYIYSSTTFHSNDASQFYATNADAAGSGVSANTILQSPSFSTVGYTALSLQFYHYYKYYSGASNDSGTVEVSINGTTWTPVQVYKGADVGSASGFALATINLNAYVNQPTLYVRFHYTSGWGYYWNIDNVTVTGTNVGYTYAWSSTPAGYISTLQNNPSVTPTVATTYTYTATVTNAAGCSVSATTAPVTVNPLPAVTITPSAATAVCAGLGVALTANGASTYTWSPAAGLSATTGATVTATPTATTTYIVTGTSAAGCVNTATKAVTVNPLPSVTITPAAASVICAGFNVALTGNGAVTYAWAPSATLSAATGTTVTATPTATTTYTVTGTDANGCINTATKTVTVNPLPNVSITPASALTFCGSANIALTGNGAVTYSWTPSTTLSAATGTTVTATPTATTTYTVTGTDANGCVNIATKTVTVNPLPNVSITPAAATTFCAGGSVVLTGNGAVSYTWAPSGSLSAATGTTVTATPTATTTYTVTGTDANGCINTATKLVTVNPLPSVSVSPATPVVFCGTTGSTSTTLTASGASTYSWSPATALSATTGATVTATPTSTITYTMTGTDGNGCQNTAQKTITINPLPTINISPVTAPTICSGNSTTLTASSSTAISYSWTPSATLSSGTGATVTATPTATTTYTVTGTDANGCQNTATRTVNVNLSPTVSISPAAAIAYCAGTGSAVLTANGASTYVWTQGGSPFSTGAIVTVAPAATTTYTVTGTATNGCTGAATKTVTIYPLPTIVVSPTTATAICRGFSVGLSATGASTYAWTPSGSLNPSTGAGPSVTATPSATTTYTVTGTDINGCVNTATKTVTVNSLPNVVISPAGTTTICRNNSIALSVTGASTYVWTPVAGLSSGTGSSITATPTATTTYSVTGTDANGCTATDSKQIIVNQLPVISISPTTAVTICSGFGVTLTASGASTYAWTPSGTLSSSTGASVTATPPATTTYTVTGTDINGCSNTAARTVFVNGLPNVTITTTAPTTICPGTSILLTAGGAVTYVWTPAATLSASTGPVVNATPPVTTTYTVTGTAANGCVNTATKTITVYPKPIPDFTPSGYLKICQFDSVTLNALPGYLTYSWRIYGTPIQTATTNTLTTGTGGFYTLQVTDSNNCISTTDSATIVTVVQRPIPVLYHYRTLLYVDSAYNSYAWYRNGAAIAGANKPSYTATQTGIYNVVVTTDSINCAGSSLPFNITNLSVLNPALGEAVKLYPNPATDILRIEAPVAVSVTVNSMDGKQVFYGDDVRQINISEWTDGVYSFVIRDKTGAYLKAEKVTKVSR